MPTILNKTRISELEKTINKVLYIIEKTEKSSSTIGWIRFLVFVTEIVIFFSLFFFSLKNEALYSLILFSIIFLFVSRRQSKILKLIEKYKKWIAFKYNNLARIKLDWNQIPGGKFDQNFEKSPLEIDLDLTGERSLHRLIDLSKSSEGSFLIRRFLTVQDISKEEILFRQNIIKELIKLSHFRHRFILESSLSSNKEIKAGSLVEWLSQTNKSRQTKKNLSVLFPLCFVNLVFILLGFFNLVSGVWGITLLLYTGFYLLNQKTVKSLASESDFLSDELKKVIRVFEFVENYNFGSNSNIIKLCSPLLNKKESPSSQLKKINNVITILDFRNNPFLWIFAILLFPLDYYLAYRIEIYKSKLIKQLPEWLDVRNKLEAFISLANFAYLNPDYTFPNILDNNQSGVHFSAQELGHPLIPFEQKKKNNCELTGIGNISIITGSNMSGKSTFLRTVGINLCLAYAGAPVDAKYFSMSMMKLFTCIKVSDSVIDGISYFYAEVQRLKKLLDELDSETDYPILFLIDEIFKGTNNKERLIGSRSMIKSLVSKNGAGLISTHDLELIHLAEEIPSIKNFHFKEDIIDGKMHFDYTLRGGPCPSTNALEIMRRSGLPIE